MRHATQIHTELKIGSKVKILVKEYATSHEVYHGVIVGFENFASLPTIEVAYLKVEYNGNPTVKFASVNAKTAEKFEIVPAIDWSPMAKKEDALAYFDNQIFKLEKEIQDLKDRKSHCSKYFDAYSVGKRI